MGEGVGWLWWGRCVWLVVGVDGGAEECVCVGGCVWLVVYEHVGCCGGDLVRGE